MFAGYKHKGLSLVSLGVKDIVGKEVGSSQELSQNMPPEALPSCTISLTRISEISEFSDGSVITVWEKPEALN